MGKAGDHHEEDIVNRDPKIIASDLQSGDPSKVADAASLLRHDYHALTIKNFDTMITDLQKQETASGHLNETVVHRDPTNNEITSIDFHEPLDQKATGDPAKGGDKNSKDRLFKDQTAVLFDKNTYDDNNSFIDFTGVTDMTAFRNQSLDAFNQNKDQKQIIVQSNPGDATNQRVFLNGNDQNNDLNDRDVFNRPATNKENQVIEDLTKVFTDKNASFTTSLDESKLTSVLSQAQLHTVNPPMENGNDAYANTVTNQNEKALVEKLLDRAKDPSSGQISYKEIADDAMKVCNNDVTSAMLTLANFSKNLASVERRQVYEPENIRPELRDTYTVTNMDTIAGKIESLADPAAPGDPKTRSDMVNNEGALYHFFGSAWAAYQTGLAGKLEGLHIATNLETLRNGHESTEYEAGLSGASLGGRLNWHKPIANTVSDAWRAVVDEAESAWDKLF